MDVCALILAGGLGTRLRPSVGDLPKVLAPVNGIPFLLYILQFLEEQGIRKIVLCTGYKADQVEKEIGNYYHSASIQYSREESQAGTGGAIRLALSVAQGNPLLILNGDTFCRFSFSRLITFHHNKQADATIVLARMANTSRYGRIEVGEDAAVKKFEEKREGLADGFINAGVYLVNREMIEEIPTDRFVSLEKEVFPGWISRRFFGFFLENSNHYHSFIDIGTPDDYRNAENFFSGMAVA